MKILIADESALITSVSFRILQKVLKNAEVIVSNSEKETLECIQTQKPEIIIIDISGSGINGAKIISEISKQDKPEKVIFLSQFDDDEYKQKAYELKGLYLNKINLEFLPKFVET